MAIKEGKKRFYLTLTEETYKEFRAMFKSFGAPSGTEVIVLDEFMKSMVTYVKPLVEKAKASGRDVSFLEFMAMYANMMQEAEKDAEQGKLL